jgi:peptidoglycan hydrolase FlgJ
MGPVSQSPRDMMQSSTLAQFGVRSDANMTQEDIDRVASEFEAMFIGQLLAPLFEGISNEAPFGGGPGEDAFRPMLIQEYAKAFQSTGGLGLADSVRTEMLRLQGLDPNGRPAEPLPTTQTDRRDR